MRIELEKNRALGVPVVVYDRKSQIIYRENDDGTRTEVGTRMRKERYSEQISKKPEIVIFAGPNGSGKIQNSRVKVATCSNFMK